MYVDPYGLYVLESDSNGNVYAIIESGDTLSGIAYSEVGDANAYTKMNYSGNPNEIYVGQRINITGIYNKNYPNPFIKFPNTTISNSQNIYNTDNDAVEMLDTELVIVTAAVLTPVIKYGIGLLGSLNFAKPSVDYPKPDGWNEDWRWGYPEGDGYAEPRWFDPNGGEWRYHYPDKYHKQGHWDYNPWDQWNSPWQNIYPK